MRLGLALYFVSSVIEKKKKESLKWEAILEDFFNISDSFGLSLHRVILG